LPFRVTLTPWEPVPVRPHPTSCPSPSPASGSRVTTPASVSSTRPLFNFHSTAPPGPVGLSLKGKRGVITGAASGIGVETARALARIGGEIALAVRDTEAGERVAADLIASTGNAAVRVMPLDLSDRASIASFVTAWDGPLNVLIN